MLLRMDNCVVIPSQELSGLIIEPFDVLTFADTRLK